MSNGNRPGIKRHLYGGLANLDLAEATEAARCWEPCLLAQFSFARARFSFVQRHRPQSRHHTAGHSMGLAFWDAAPQLAADDYVEKLSHSFWRSRLTPLQPCGAEASGNLRTLERSSGDAAPVDTPQRLWGVSG